jgi:TnpA family transposase
VVKKGVEALERGRLSHVAQCYMSAETFSRANAPLITAQAGIPFADTLGGGLVAAIDGMRFVVPVPSIYTRPNRKYFGPKRGLTWLNMINDQGAGLGAKVVTGTVRDSLHMIDMLFSQDGGCARVGAGRVSAWGRVSPRWQNTARRGQSRRTRSR